VSAPPLRLHLTPWVLAVCRFPADAPLPVWVLHAEAQFWSLTRTPNELSVVCAEDDLPPSVDTHVERGWRAFHVQGPLPFTLTGVVAGLTAPLAEAGVPVFVISTYDTDVLLVKATDLARAREVLARTCTITD
jgi:uncharacterized protein